ncbi:MAG: type VI secretion system tip protein TssI/VgrG [Polyangiaceae bacterium]
MPSSEELDASELEQLARSADLDASSTSDVTISLDGSGGDVVLAVRAFVGAEALHRRYAFDVVCLAPSELVADPVDELLGLNAALHLPGGRRVVRGVVERVSVLSTHEARSRSGLVRVTRVRLVPALALLAHTQRSRVFQDLSADRIVAAVLGAERVAVRTALARPLPIRSYAVQYEESDADFVERLVHEDGLVSFFEHTSPGADHASAGERWVLADDRGAYTPLDDPAVLAVDPSGGSLNGTADSLDSFARVGRVRPTSLVLRNADPARARPAVGRALPSPQRDGATAVDGGVVTATARSATHRHRELEVYEHHAPYEEPEVGAANARTQLEQLRSAAETFEGSSRCARLRPGGTFRVRGSMSDRDPGEVAIVSVAHRYFAGGGAGRDRGATYENQFTCVPSSVVHRPPRPARRVVQAVETATVVGVVGEDVTTTSLGSVKIQFPWDREGTHDDASSCWVRVAQPWSGAGYGFQFIPRVGAEVLVAFIGGDPDRPVIVGCLPNPHNALPFALPDSATQSGIRTRTSPGGEDYNELAFVDTRGSEAVRIRAARDHEEEVVRNQRSRIGGAQAVSIGESRAVAVTGHDELSVGAGRSERIVGEATRTVHGRSFDVVDANRERLVRGQEIARIEGSQSTVVGADMQVIVGGSGEGSVDIQAASDVRLVGKDRVDVVSPKEIRLLCGDTRVVLTPEGLFVDAPKIVLRSPDIALASDKGLLEIAEDVALSADTIRLEGEQARLHLTRDARLLGSRIELAGPEARTAEDEDETTSPGEAVFRITPTAAHPGPFTLTIAAPTGEILERTTDENHEVRLEGGEREAFVLLRVLSGETELHHHQEE